MHILTITLLFLEKRQTLFSRKTSENDQEIAGTTPTTYHRNDQNALYLTRKFLSSLRLRIGNKVIFEAGRF